MSMHNLTANGVGTKDWLEATKNLTIKAYTESSQPPQTTGNEPLNKEGFESVLWKVSWCPCFSAPDESTLGTSR